MPHNEKTRPLPPDVPHAATVLDAWARERSPMHDAAKADLHATGNPAFDGSGDYADARLGALERDAARLDWLAYRETLVEFTGEDENPWRVKVGYTPFGTVWVEAATLRDAIDAAMSEPNVAARSPQEG